MVAGAYVVAGRDQPRVRRAADVTTAVIGLVLVIWGVAVFHVTDPIQGALSSFAATLPEWVVGALALGYTAGLLYAVAVLLLLFVGRRWKAVRDVMVAGGLSAFFALVLVAVYDQLWPVFFTEFSAGVTPPQFPVVRVALVTGVLVAATPHLTRTLRRLGWLIIVIVSAAAVALAFSVPSGVVAAVGVGLTTGALVLLVFGSPKGYPDVTEVAGALRRVGLEIADLTIANDQSWGVRRLVGTCVGEPVEIKAYGRDATDSQVMAKVWHSLMYRGATRRLTFSRIQSVEHEALVMLRAGNAGARVPELRAAAAATEDVAVLVTSRPGTALSDPSVGSDGRVVHRSALVDLWRQVAAVHAAGMSHGALGVQAVLVADDRFVLTDWSAGSLLPRAGEQELDVVNLLFATAVIVGPQEAVAAAAEGLGRDRLSAATGYLQPPALPRRSRRSTDDAGALLTALRDEVVRVTDSSLPEPVRLRRLGVRQIVTIVLALLFLSALVPLLTGIDYSDIWAALEGADWWLVGLALVVGQVAFVPQGTAMMSAVGRAIPLRPMTILQPAVAFISFAVPGMAGRVAMESAFLFKYGITPSAAVTKGAVDAFSGFLVQVTILVVALLTGALTLAPPSASEGNTRSLSWGVLAVILSLALAVVVIVWRVPKVHDRVVPEIGKAWVALMEVLRSPRRALGLLVSQVVVQLLWGLALWTALLALGTHLSLISATAVVVGTALLQGIIPVPGGIGVSEAVLSALMIPLGVPAGVALGAAVIWRVATFYLPAVEGVFASRYLQRHGYL